MNVGMRDEPLDRRPISGLTISRRGPCSTPPTIRGAPPPPSPLLDGGAAPPVDKEGGVGMALLRSSSDCCRCRDWRRRIEIDVRTATRADSRGVVIMRPVCRWLCV